MTIHKDEKFNTWYVKIRYTDWTGSPRQTTKRGFKRKKESQDYEINFQKQQTGAVSMPFKSMFELYMKDAKSRVRTSTYQIQRPCTEVQGLI